MALSSKVEIVQSGDAAHSVVDTVALKPADAPALLPTHVGPVLPVRAWIRRADSPPPTATNE